MCGIVGHVRPAGQTAQYHNIVAASRLLAHRGPDGEGIINWPGACLAHRRLSILDLEHSSQPWVSEDGRYAMVFNGEIYNYRELRETLRKKGVHFRSRGDTEVLFQLYIHMGADCLNLLNGMFAFAIWDRQKSRLFMARDRLGKKPLYFARVDDGLAFASEISALRAIDGISHDIDTHAVHDYFAYQFIPGNRSIYSDINKLQPAHYLEFTDGEMSIRRYWSPPRPETCNRSIDDLGEQLRDILMSAVDIRMRSDVPLGAFLSGGIDSAVIVATMRKLGVTAETFTVGFNEKSYDESDAARQTADFLKSHHHQAILQQDLSNLPDKWLHAFGEPFADHSAIPVWHVCEYARRHVTVALSGDGGDELFAGYRRYRGRQLMRGYNALPDILRKAIARFSRLLPNSDDYYANSLPKQLRLFLAMQQRFSETPNDLIPQTFTASERQQLLGDEPAPVSSRDSIDELCLNGIDSISQMQLSDINSYLPEDILTKVDRMSMAHGLEVRAPMLDYRLVEFICRLPVKYKIHHGEQKYLLKKAFHPWLPEQLMHRKKQGFNLPIAGWLKGSLKLAAEETILYNIPAWCNHHYVHKLWDEHQGGKIDHSAKLWTLFVFGLWHQNIYQSS